MANKKKKRELKTIIASQIKTSEKFQVEEAYKMARANLSFSILKEESKRIVVTSALNSEGKSTTSVNLAVALSQQLNTKVLLIDCDLRKPRANQFFDLPNKPGVTDYLAHKNELNEIIRETEIENLSIICSGTVPPNPSEILSSSYYKEFLDEVQEKFDYVIIDTSPLNLVSDALSIAKISDGVVLSVMHGSSTHPELSKTLDILKRVDAKILGFILHGVSNSKKYIYNYYG